MAKKKPLTGKKLEVYRRSHYIDYDLAVYRGLLSRKAWRDAGYAVKDDAVPYEKLCHVAGRPYDAAFEVFTLYQVVPMRGEKARQRREKWATNNQDIS